MLLHHDHRDYETAAADARNRAVDHLNALVEKGRARAGQVLDQIVRDVPRDAVVPASKLVFEPVGPGVEISIDGDLHGLHKNALGQVASRASIPMAYVRHLQDNPGWGTELLAANLNDLYGKGPASKKRYLTRSVDHQVRGFLSDRYRRLDSRPIVEAFCAAADEIGAVPIEGYALDTKIAIKALLPTIYEPVPNEVMAFGIALENSDFGNGALSVRAFCLRLWCTNYAITDDCLRRVHLGRRLDEDFTYSEKTYRLDTKASASAINDVVGGTLGADRIEKMCALIGQANEERVDASKVKGFLRRHLKKGEADAATEAFNGADVEMLPPGNTKWRLSNAVSWIAGQTEDRERALDLMKVAGAALA